MANEVLIHVKAKDDASKSISKIDAGMKKFAGVAGLSAAAAGAAVIKFGADSVKAASDLNETMNKTNVVFGKNSQEIVKWSTTSAQKLGLSQQAALAAASSFGLMFKQLGSSGTESVKLSQKVVKLAADLGSFHNLDTADVMDRISAAFRGEYDSLQQLVPTINAARVEKEALAMTGKKNADALTAEEKAMAALKIVTESSKSALNDFAETSDGLANTQKILTARLENLKAKIGEALLPAVLDLAGAIGDVFDKWESSGQMAEDLEDLAAGARNAQEAFAGFGEANTAFQDMILDQKKAVLEWRIFILKYILMVAQAFAKLSPKMQTVVDDLAAMLGEAEAEFNKTAKEINDKEIKPKLQADKRDAEKKLRDINRQLDKTHGKKARAKLLAEKAQAENAINRITFMLNQIPGSKTTTLYVNTVRTGVGRTRGDRGGGMIGGLDKAAAGGIKGNQTLVGEEGPEIVDLPMGSRVLSHQQSKMEGMGGGDIYLTLDLGEGITQRLRIHDRQIMRAVGAGRSGY